MSVPLECRRELENSSLKVVVLRAGDDYNVVRSRDLRPLAAFDC